MRRVSIRELMRRSVASRSARSRSQSRGCQRAPAARARGRRGDDARHATPSRTLLKNGADVNAAQGDGMTALHWAARNGDAELAQMLLYAGANVKATTRLGGYTPLMMAADQGHATVIAALLTGGADAKAANALGTTPLMLAAASGNPQAVTIARRERRGDRSEGKDVRPDAADVCRGDQSRRGDQGADQGRRQT